MCIFRAITVYSIPIFIYLNMYGSCTVLYSGSMTFSITHVAIVLCLSASCFLSFSVRCYTVHGLRHTIMLQVTSSARSCLSMSLPLLPSRQVFLCIFLFLLSLFCCIGILASVDLLAYNNRVGKK